MSVSREQSAAAAPSMDLHSGGDIVAVEEVSASSWIERRMTPTAVLVTFSLLNLVTYFDRGAIAGSLQSIKVDRRISGSSASLSDTMSGLIVSGFMVGFMCTCPLFAALGTHMPSKQIILMGMAMWSIASLSTAVSLSYTMLLLSRILVGAGEAAFVGFTVTIIDNIAPKPRRTLWIGIFYSMIPLGTAFGMMMGGLASDAHSLFGLPLQPWRALFIGQVTASLPILFIIAALPARYDATKQAVRDDILGDEHNTSSDEERSSDSYVPIGEATRSLLGNSVYLLVVCGFAMYCFVVGAISVWAIPFLVRGPLGLPTGRAAVVMGVSTSVCGVVGSIFGGWVVDRLGGSHGPAGGAKCLQFSAAMVAVCIPCGIYALLQTELGPFLVAFIVSVVALFSLTAPVNAAILTVVPHVLRPYAVSYSVFVIHFLGDFPSPTIAGALSDAFNRGCSDASDAATCTAMPTNTAAFHRRQCSWVGAGAGRATLGEHSSVGYCVNTVQLRDALLIVFCILTIAIPCWVTAVVRLGQRTAHYDEQFQDANDIIISS